jgi:hypothetical protein
VSAFVYRLPYVLHQKLEVQQELLGKNKQSYSSRAHYSKEENAKSVEVISPSWGRGRIMEWRG